MSQGTARPKNKKSSNYKSGVERTNYKKEIKFA
jgi:hypothetical protein